MTNYLTVTIIVTIILTRGANMSIIEELFTNSKSVWEKIEPSEEYKKLIAENVNLYNKITGYMNDAQKKDLSDYIDTHIGMEYDSSVNYFKEGVKFGVLFAFEILNN